MVPEGLDRELCIFNDLFEIECDEASASGKMVGEGVSPLLKTGGGGLITR